MTAFHAVSIRDQQQPVARRSSAIDAAVARRKSRRREGASLIRREYTYPRLGACLRTRTLSWSVGFAGEKQP